MYLCINFILMQSINESDDTHHLIPISIVVYLLKK